MWYLQGLSHLNIPENTHIVAKPHHQISDIFTYFRTLFHQYSDTLFLLKNRHFINHIKWNKCLLSQAILLRIDIHVHYWLVQTWNPSCETQILSILFFLYNKWWCNWFKINHHITLLKYLNHHFLFLLNPPFYSEIRVPDSNGLFILKCNIMEQINLQVANNFQNSKHNTLPCNRGHFWLRFRHLKIDING